MLVHLAIHLLARLALLPIPYLFRLISFIHKRMYAMKDINSHTPSFDRTVHIRVQVGGSLEGQWKKYMFKKNTMTYINVILPDVGSMKGGVVKMRGDDL
jgi:hypothetical protein